jgi:ABC-2 type transport system ATP-binding protein
MTSSFRTLDPIPRLADGLPDPGGVCTTKRALWHLLEVNDELPAVRLRGVTKRYGSFTALDDVSLDIRQGEVFALLGPNGAGKTTLISLVAGITRATSGTVEVLGHDVITGYRHTRRAVGLVPQEINFDPFFTVEEALRFQAGYFGVQLPEERLVEILSALGLLDKRKSNTRALSGGMKRRLLIAKALVHRPPVLFLDEPTAGVDVELRRDLWNYVRKLAAEGTTVVLTTHYLEEAEQLADRIGVIKGGKLLVVEGKDSLLARLGRRSVRLLLEKPLGSLPPALGALGATLEDGGHSVLIHSIHGQPLSAALAACASAGVAIGDVETQEPRLESVILDLLHAKELPEQSALQRDSGSRATGGLEAAASARHASEAAPGSKRAATLPEPIHPLLGVRTLFEKEVRRFMRVPGQTILSPLVTTSLYFLVFGYSLGGRLREVDGVSYSRFLVPGLVMLGIINNAFLNTSSSLFIMKLQGTIVDLLVTPLTYVEVLAAFLAAACTRALLVGVLTWLTAAVFVGAALPHFFLAIGAALLVSIAFASAGLIVALWADKFEQVNFIPTFVITPLTFLGGVFYAASMLPNPFHRALLVNPIYYMIESMRFALLGASGVAPILGFGVVAVLGAAVTSAALELLRRGYKLRP